MLKIIIVDDQVLLRKSMGIILGAESDLKVVGEAGNGLEAIEMCEKLKPDLVLMDIEMPEMDGVKATEIIKGRFPKVKVIILTTFENPDNVMGAFVVGADGYIVKNIGQKELIKAIACVADGLTVLHESVKNIIIRSIKGVHSHRSVVVDSLTDKEIQIIGLVAAGHSNKEIAVTMAYSEGTIKNYISKILTKLELFDRMQIAIFAIENGLA